jgi:predicted N-acetyltransferase YhbS
VQIELLADRPEFIPTLAEWHFREWAYLRPGDSVANRIRLLHDRSNRTELPITFIATAGPELLGSAMLIHHEMDTRPQLTPWLAGVFVAPAHRRRGIGRALAEHVITEAAALGFATVYLFTPSAEHFFSRLGWSIVEHTTYRDTDVAIMSHTQPT